MRTIQLAHVLKSELSSTVSLFEHNFNSKFMTKRSIFLWFRIPRYLLWLWLCFVRILGQLDGRAT